MIFELCLWNSFTDYPYTEMTIKARTISEAEIKAQRIIEKESSYSVVSKYTLEKAG